MSNDWLDADVTHAVTAYPAELAGDLVTDNGVLVSLRPIRPSDASMLVHFHDRLSSRSIYRRYFSLHPQLTDEEVRHLTVVDYVDRFAFIVEHAGELIGVGRFDRAPGTSEAEVAFIVSDEFHHQGVGLMLLERLAEVAWSLGISTFTAETQADNRSMMGVFRASGFSVVSSIDEEVISARFSIEPSEASRASRARRRGRVTVVAPVVKDGP
ncbi:MAG: GNAT family N-acetyltransferase [Acidimicrobiales bacterium]